jgi:hypothetical protein
MTPRRSVRIALSVTTILFLIFTGYVAFYLPFGWRNIALGMSRTEVIALLGKPDFDSGNIKGCFWIQGKTPVRFELNVFFDPTQKVQLFSIDQYLGPRDGSYVRHISYAPKRET